ncbi:hypothetical protein [Serratia marcescens]|uniref:hypothetical protein n=1 Tax=Serratia marcescens TaxID=615 RepID=UPI000745086E|nr:hypothetical protein [Serratia marcescens]CUY61341.1 Uncharacterised protein [Serratia marcescens]CUY67459.1 Uncharacterised protein [Serratia marcescens]CVA65906.1 Uncharacterised protein [Serratia marcescens]CVA69218.1 Uncharacterised protein [Serratia marcescens]CVA72180.1 Uncharacterised protein [Serratia marcescens]
MDNKLSELSNPVAYSLRFRNMNGEPDKTINANTTFSTLEKAKAYGLGSRYVTQDDGKIVNVRDPSQDPIVEPLYSQEYVSALLEDNERVARDLVARNGEIEGLRKRAAELESIRADASQVFKEIGNELGCNPDNESIMMAIDALKERLDTPVRLPGKTSDLDSWDGGWDACLEECAEAIRAAGFKVEGDE